jgi:prevent-host-death family protein
MTERVGVRALQQNASAVVARAAAGETIEITDRGRPVAQVVPLGQGRLAALVRAGLARPARQRIRDLPPPLPRRRSGRSLGDLLAESRHQER